MVALAKEAIPLTLGHLFPGPGKEKRRSCLYFQMQCIPRSHVIFSSSTFATMPKDCNNIKTPSKKYTSFANCGGAVRNSLISHSLQNSKPSHLRL